MAVTTEETLDVRSALIRQRQAVGYASQVSWAERMVKRNQVDLQHREPGDNVAVPVPLVDCGRGDLRNIRGLIVHRDLETYICTIAVKAGSGVKWRILRNQFVS